MTFKFIFLKCISLFTALHDVWTPTEEQLSKALGPFHKLLTNAHRYHYLGSSSPVTNFIMPSGVSCSVLPSLHLWTLPVSLPFPVPEGKLHALASNINLQTDTGDEFLGPNHKHLASSEGTASNPSKVTEPQLCLLPIVAWQRLGVAFRQTWITQIPKILSNSCL